MTDPLVGPYTWPGADEASVVPQREGVVARIVVNVRPDAAFDFLHFGALTLHVIITIILACSAVGCARTNNRQ
jgi:hypothetical protein